MEIEGKIISILPAMEGISKTGNPWKVQPYVLETLDQYPRKVYFEIMGAERIEKNACQLDDQVKVSFDVESREYNGRWYTTCRAWRIDEATPAAQPVAQKQAPKPAAAPKVEGAEEASTDLPF